MQLNVLYFLCGIRRVREIRMNGSTERVTSFEVTKAEIIYRCVNCGKSWGEQAGNPEAIPSHGLCKKCLKECLAKIYKRRQLAEGNFDCFGKADGYCDQLQCRYRGHCLD